MCQNKVLPLAIIASSLALSSTVQGADPDHELRSLTSASGSHMGHAVALDGDTMVVGAPYYDGSGSAIGRVLVFTWDGAAWNQVASLTPSGLDDHAHFGWSLDIDNETIIVGAPGEPDDDDDSHMRGAAFLYSGSGGDWNLLNRIQPVEGVDYQGPDGFYHQRINDFGRAVSLDGTTAVVGSDFSHHLTDEVRDGAAWVLYCTSGSWGIAQRISTMDTDQTNRADFACALALDHDTLVIGAPNYYHNGDANEARGIAQVYTYSTSSGTFVFQQTLRDTNGDSGDAFGEAVAIDGNTIAIGNSEDDLDGHDTGSVTVFKPKYSSWSKEVVLTSCDTSDDTFQLGRSVAVENSIVVAGGTSLSAMDDSASSVIAWNITAPGISHMLGRHEAGQVSPVSQLGSSVALHNGRIASGAPEANLDDGAWTWDDIGAVFVWDTIADDRDANGEQDWAQMMTHSHDWNGNCVPDEADCLADWSGTTNGEPDGMVDATDLLDLIVHWGPHSGNGSASGADFNEDLRVGLTDLLHVLTEWGSCG